MKLDFRCQMRLGIILVIICFTTALLLNNQIFNNIGWVLYGALWMFHPVFPEHQVPKKKHRILMRLAGVGIILIGLTAHLG